MCQASYLYREFHLLFVSDFSDTALVRFPRQESVSCDVIVRNTFRCPPHETQARVNDSATSSFHVPVPPCFLINSSLSFEKTRGSPRVRTRIIPRKGTTFSRKSNAPVGKMYILETVVLEAFKLRRRVRRNRMCFINGEVKASFLTMANE